MTRYGTYLSFRDHQGKAVRLSLARWRHIRRRHPDVSEEDVRLALKGPDRVDPNPTGLLYRRNRNRRTVVVAVKEVRGLYIRTAYVEDLPGPPLPQKP